MARSSSRRWTTLPVAGDDTLVVPEDTAGQVDLQANDSDVDGDPLTAAVQAPPAAGELDVDPAGTATYVPEPDRTGAEAAAYAATDPSGLSDQADLDVLVQPQPDPPVATDDAVDTPAGTPLDIAASDLLANDSDPDGDPVTLAVAVASPPANGVLSYDGATGIYRYTPAPGFSGTDRFTYSISDGTATAAATVVVTVGPPPPETGLVLGTSGSGPDDWDLVPGTPTAQSPVPDSDGDGDPGLTVEHSGGHLDENDGRKYQNWSTDVPADLQLAGAAALELRSSLEGGLLSKEGHVWAYLQDCAPGAASTDDGTACQVLASVDEHVDDWSLLPGFQQQGFDMGVVDATVPAGNSLRLKLLFQHKDTWVDPAGSQLVLNAPAGSVSGSGLAAAGTLEPGAAPAPPPPGSCAGARPRVRCRPRHRPGPGACAGTRPGARTGPHRLPPPHLHPHPHRNPHRLLPPHRHPPPRRLPSLRLCRSTVSPSPLPAGLGGVSSENPNSRRRDADGRPRPGGHGCGRAAPAPAPSPLSSRGRRSPARRWPCPWPGPGRQSGCRPAPSRS